MKKSTLALITAASLAAVLACAKKDHKNPTDKADPKTDSAQTLDAKAAQEKAAKAGFPLSASGKRGGPGIGNRKEIYKGPLVTLTNDGGYGWIHIDDEDARAIYDALKLKTYGTAENDSYGPGDVAKSGKHIRCYLANPKQEPKTPEKACSIFIDYRNGSVAEMPVVNQEDTTVPEVQKVFKGSNVMLNPKAENGSIGIIMFSPADAKALYTNMNVPTLAPKEQSSSTEGKVFWKYGQSIRCRKGYDAKDAKKIDYKCDMTFDYKTGQVHGMPMTENFVEATDTDAAATSAPAATNAPTGQQPAQGAAPGTNNAPEANTSGKNDGTLASPPEVGTANPAQSQAPAPATAAPATSNQAPATAAPAAANGGQAPITATLVPNAGANPNPAPAGQTAPAAPAPAPAPGPSAEAAPAQQGQLAANIGTAPSQAPTQQSGLSDAIPYEP